MKSDQREGNVNPGPHRQSSHSVLATITTVCFTKHLLHGAFHSIFSAGGVTGGGGFHCITSHAFLLHISFVPCRFYFLL